MKAFDPLDYRDDPSFHNGRQLVWSVYLLTFSNDAIQLPGLGPFETQLEAAETREELHKAGITGGLVLNPSGYKK